MLPLFCICITTIVLSSHAFRITDRSKANTVGCRYEGRRYEEGAVVTTSEPCLQCRCTEGSLRCRLRICPRLPNPPPPGCRTQPPLGPNACCSMLVCSESDEINMLHYADADEANRNRESDSCLYEGVRYGPGSAMMSSRRCEYCYCIGGNRRCIRPKCLLSLPGCRPQYSPHSCCPVSYDCNHAEPSTTLASISEHGCQIGGRVYKEGEMIRDIQWKAAACDNCFCAMGAIRCVPLACAPPLQGCTPIIREGQCCPSTYNCSCSIQVKAFQNYASYAFISKDYAKLRKETNFFPIHAMVEGRGHRVNTQESNTLGYTNEDSVTSTIQSTVLNANTETMDNEIITESVDYTKSTTFNDDFSTTPLTTISSEITESTITYNQPPTNTPGDSSTTDTSEIFTYANTILDDTATTGFSAKHDGTSALSSIEQTTNVIFSESNTCQENLSENKTCHDTVADVNVNKEITQTEIKIEGNRNKTIIKTEKDFPIEISTPEVITSDINWAAKGETKTIVSIGDNITSTTVNPEKTLPLDIEALLNNSQQEKDEDYVYDYNEPTLPPSLPNLRIIPFVAADALVKDKDDRQPLVTNYPAGVSPTESVFSDLASQVNRFSPPVETEGGFMPKEPPYFDPLYHSNGLNLAVGTGVTVIPDSFKNANRKSDLTSDCLFEGHEYSHSKVLPSSSVCLTCVCYYGKVICSKKECPLVKIGCRRISNPADKCCGKIVCAESEESPTVVLNRADAPESSQMQPLVPAVSPDPFRDVIKTEPAPDLPSLIEDMIPYFAITSVKSTSAEIAKKNVSASLDEKVGVETTTKFAKPGAVEDSTSRYIEETTANASTSIMGPRRDATGTTNLPLTALDNEITTTAVGLLKLAGCNIYGRMYHVGTIITELSSLCQECNCTQSGVLCKQLEC